MNVFLCCYCNFITPYSCMLFWSTFCDILKNKYAVAIKKRKSTKQLLLSLCNVSRGVTGKLWLGKVSVVSEKKWKVLFCLTFLIFLLPFSIFTILLHFPPFLFQFSSFSATFSFFLPFFLASFFPISCQNFPVGSFCPRLLRHWMYLKIRPATLDQSMMHLQLQSPCKGQTEVNMCRNIQMSSLMSKNAKIQQCRYVNQKNPWPMCNTFMGSKVMQWSTRIQFAQKWPVTTKFGQKL